jgi:hypothetical protein
MIAKRKILNTFQMKANNYVLILKKKKDIEDHSIKIIKGKKSPKTLDCIVCKCDFENISSEDK